MIRYQRFNLELLQQFAIKLLGTAQNLSHHKNILGLSWQMLLRITAVILLCTGFMLAPVKHSKAAEITFFSATQVDELPMGSTRRVRAVNDNGDIAGTVKKEDHRGPSGVIWHKDGFTETVNFDEHKKQKRKRAKNRRSREEKSLDFEDYSSTSGINNSYQVVGSMNTDTGMRAYLHDLGGKPVLLEMPHGDTGSEALAINLSGESAGWSSGPNGIKAVMWNSAGEVQILPDLPGSKSCRAVAINDSGDAVGVCDTASGRRAILWTGGSDKTALDLGTLPGDSWSEASSINEEGDVVGTSGQKGGQHHAVLWPKGGDIEDLGTLTGQTSSKALAINKKGIVVGISEYNDGRHISDERAFIWTPQRGMEDLNDLVVASSNFVLSHAIAISSRGLITAIGRHLDPETESHSHGTHELPLQVFRLNPQRGRAK